MERALLVSIKINSEKDSWHLEDYAMELEELTATCGAEVVDNIACLLRDRPTPNLFIGKGKAAEIGLLCQEENIDTVIFSHDLSGTQQRNLEEVIGRKTIDRTQLILDIFARHAKTLEGKTQVELAQLQYLLPRLIGKGIILSRLGGGIGTRGPGEQKLEIDRRDIRRKIAKLQNDLKTLRLHRKTLRKKRQDNAIPSVVLVGYTNAGKSTLLNTFTGAGQVVSNSLFTTLDPLSKSLKLPNGENIVVSDTVGFLHQLPHHLIEAFKATLEEVEEADLLIHVLDAAHPRALELNKAVFTVLKELEVEDKPMITALNKIDLLTDKVLLSKLSEEVINPVCISAQSGQNLSQLFAKIEENFQSRMTALTLIIPHARMDLIDLFYRKGQVKEIKYQQHGIKVSVSLPKIIAYNLLQNKEIEHIY
jgi:GTP-binding protein HflX